MIEIRFGLLFLSLACAACAPEQAPVAKGPTKPAPGGVIQLFSCSEPPDRPECHTTPCLARLEHQGDEWLLFIDREPRDPKFARGTFDAYVTIIFRREDGQEDFDEDVMPGDRTKATLGGLDWKRTPPIEAQCKRFDKGPPLNWHRSA